MQAISDKIRHYRKTFRPPVFYALGSLALWLSIVLAALILGLMSLDLYLRFAKGRELLDTCDQLALLLLETPLLFGMLQAYFMGAERRYRQLHPSVRQVNLRTPKLYLGMEKRAYLQSTFEHDGDLRVLAKTLVEEWEWRRELRNRAQEPLWRRAMGFFGLPSASNFAAYLTGLVAVIAGIVIATMTPEVVFGSFGQFLDDTWTLIRMLWMAIVLPFALCVLPGAVILSTIKNIGEALLEWLNDQYLSQTDFYRFISELLDLHDRGERLLLRKTRAHLYWAARLTMAQIQDLPKVWRRIKRARGLSKRLASTKQLTGLA